MLAARYGTVEMTRGDAYHRYSAYASSGVNFATLHRFPRIVEGDYLEGGLTSDQISNRVVDALGDIAGGVRIHDQTREAT